MTDPKEHGIKEVSRPLHILRTIYFLFSQLSETTDQTHAEASLPVDSISEGRLPKICSALNLGDPHRSDRLVVDTDAGNMGI